MKPDQCSPLLRLAGLCMLLIFSSCKRDHSNVPDPIPTPAPDPAPVIGTILKPVSDTVTAGVYGYYISMPSNYNETTTKYPLLIYMPGTGQFGNGSIDLPLLLKDGPAQLAEEKRLPGTFTVKGQTFSMLILTPQLKYWINDAGLKDCIAYAMKKYRVDSSRIYMSGLSSGGIITTDFASTNADKLAAIVPMAGISGDWQTTPKCQLVAAGKLPVWEFHSEDDPQISINDARGYINKINSFSPLYPAKITVWPNGGHDAWTRAIEPGYRENGMNIYEWMLQYHR